MKHRSLSSRRLMLCDAFKLEKVRSSAVHSSDFLQRYMLAVTPAVTVSGMRKRVQKFVE